MATHRQTVFVYECDRCGKKVQGSDEDVKSKKEGWIRIELPRPEFITGSDDPEIDFCNECAESLKEWLTDSGNLRNQWG